MHARFFALLVTLASFAATADMVQAQTPEAAEKAPATTEVTPAKQAIPDPEPIPEPKKAETTPVAKPAAKPTAVSPAADYVIARVGDEEIKKSEVEKIWQTLVPPGKGPDFDTLDENIRQNIVRGVISQRVLYEEAEKEGLDKTPEVQTQLAELRRKLLVRALIDRKSKGLVSENDINKEYEAMVRATKGKEEIRARHILVKTKEEAEKAKEELEDDKAFEEVAKEFSKDPGTAKKGGDLGWFPEGRMVSEFSKAAFGLKKGKISEPVQSPFGWHIIEVTDRRPLKAPTLSEARAEIEAKLQEKKLASYAEGLVKQRTVTYYDAKGHEKPLDLTPQLPESK